MNLSADGRATRTSVCVALLVLAVVTVLGQAVVRREETQLVGALVQHVFGLTTYVNPFRPQIFVANHSDPGFQQWSGVTITAECTSSWLLAPLFFIAAVAVLGRRLSTVAVLGAATATGTLLVLVNLARIAMIVASLHIWGTSGYRWSHEVFGSILSVIGMCAGVVLFLAVANRLSRRSAITPDHLTD